MSKLYNKWLALPEQTKQDVVDYLVVTAIISLLISLTLNY